jgi:hypothetical protein
MKRGLIGGIIDVDVTMKQLHNGDQEYVVLRRFPFHEAATRASAMHLHAQAVRYMFQIVPDDQWVAVMGRFSRKLIKRMHYFKKQEEL